MKEVSQLLYEWRKHRLNLTDKFTKKSLQEMMNWFTSLNAHAHGFNYDDMTTWPDAWQYISEGFYTRSGNGLAIFYTVTFAQPEKKVELWLVHDLLHSDMYLLPIVDDKYVLNRMSGNVENLKDVIKDFNILEKHNKDDVLNGIKFNN